MAWVLAPIMWLLRRLRDAVNAFVTIVLMIFLLSFVAGMIGSGMEKGVPSNTVLTLDLRRDFTDQPMPSFPFEADLSIIDVVQALARAENDDRVKGLYMRVGGAGFMYAHVQELRDALKAFKEKGKFVIAHAQAFYGNGMTEYYAASAADEIWLQPGSELNTSGIASYTVFMKGLFDKIEAVPQMEQRYEYKNAGNIFNQTDFTEAHREATTAYMQSLFDSAKADIAASRKMSAEAFGALLNNSPYGSKDALAARLVDKLGYDADAEDAATDKAGEDAETVSLAAYYARERSPYDNPFASDGVIALINGEGTIFDGESASDPFSGETGMGGDTIAEAIRDAAEDEDVKAILFRVNSPGGSAIASDQILAAVKKAQEAKKPVIVSMAGVAASGGYYVSLSADKIYAYPTTITGSIGVVGGKVAIGGTYRLVGLSPKEIHLGGPNATMMSDYEPFTPEQLAALQKQIQMIYDDFTEKVATGRKLDLATVQTIARGRVWSGADAKNLKLVDEFGGFRAALGKAVEMAGLQPDATIHLKNFTGSRGFWEEFGAFAYGVRSVFQTISTLERVVGMEPVKTVISEAEMNERMQGPQMRMLPETVR
jgi:protease IV